MIDNNQSTFMLTNNLEGRIRNLALSPSTSNSVYPLLEAIMNSIHAIQERFKDSSLKKGKILIDIERSEEDLNILVSDNGVGLNNENFGSFLTPDTDYKLQRGGKGVGRLTWLKTFYAIEVDSRFLMDGKLHKRSFVFKCDETETISEHVFEECGTGRETGTTVLLRNMRAGYLHTFPTKIATVPNHIIRHFLPIFVSGDCPEITLIDNGKEIDISAELEKNIKEQAEEIITFNGVDDTEISLKLTHMRIAKNTAPKSSPKDMMKSGKAHNAVYYAADQRVCFEYLLDTQLGMQDFGGCKYVGILEGSFLNEHMNQERTHLDINIDDDKALKSAVYDSVTAFLARFMEIVKEGQWEVYRELKNEFPSITSTTPENYIEDLPYSFTKPEEMLANLAIHKMRSHRAVKKETRHLEAKIQEVQASTDQMSIDQENEIQALVEKVRPELTRETTDTLAEYMVRRKAVIDLLDKYMGLSENGKHFKEDLIHTLICPMRKIDDAKKLLDHNLWLLDDRFAFYQFLASDAALDTYTPALDKGRPDVLFVLDEQLAFNRNNESPIFIVEFKRPAKSSYRTGNSKEWDTEDPFDRFQSYKEALQKGIDGDKTYNGRRIHITEHRPVHCFLIADMTPNLERKCKSRLERIEGANSYFGHVKELGLVHAITYDDLISNAKLRHEMFFKALGIGYEY